MEDSISTSSSGSNIEEITFKHPKFLDTAEKWNCVVSETDTDKKYERLIHKLLDDDDTDLVDFWLTLKNISKDIMAYHKDSSIIELIYAVQSILKILIQLSEQKTESGESKVGDEGK